MTRGMFGEVILDEKEEKWLRLHFKHTKNKDIAEKLNVSSRTVNRIAVKLGLTKSKQFVRRCSLESLKKAYACALAAGTLFKKGEWNHAGVENQFKKGITSRQRLGNKREDERVKKSAQTRKQTVASERRRILFGLDQQTNLRLVKEPQKKTSQRHYLRRRGYLIYGKETVAYYTDATQRCPKLEIQPPEFFTFASLADRKQ